MVVMFAGHFRAKLTPLYVLELPAYNDVMIETAAVGEQRLRGYLARELEQFDVQRVLLEGDPATQFSNMRALKTSTSSCCPRMDISAFRRFMLGSLTSKVLRDACCPVWTGVHMEQTPKLEHIAFRKVVCAIDLGSRALLR
jgi:hypothetical protein